MTLLEQERSQGINILSNSQAKTDNLLTVDAAPASYGTTAPGSSLLEESLLESLIQQELQLLQKNAGISASGAETAEAEQHKLSSMALASNMHDPQLGFGGADDPSGGLPGAAKPHICYDFTKGLCNRGDKCKYSHDLATIVTYNSKEKGICFDYLRNQCQRGLLCRFSHDLSNIAQQCQAPFPTELPSLLPPAGAYLAPPAAVPSPSISGSVVARGRTTAICYDFVKGVCQRGSECRYSHDLTLIARTARGGAGAAKVGEVCYDHLRGRCTRGPSCKYSHNISFLAAPGYLPAGELSPPGGGGASWDMEGNAFSDAAYHYQQQQQQQDSNNMMAMMMMIPQAPHLQQQQHSGGVASSYSHAPVLDSGFGYSAASLSDPGFMGAFGQEGVSGGVDGRQAYSSLYPQRQQQQQLSMHGGYYQQPQAHQQQEVDQAMMMMMGGMGGISHQQLQQQQQQQHQYQQLQQQQQYQYQQQQQQQQHHLHQQQRARSQAMPAHSAIQAIAAAQQQQQQEFARSAGERSLSGTGSGLEGFARQLSSGSQRGSSAHLADNLSTSVSEPQLSRLDGPAPNGMSPSHSQTLLGSMPMTQHSQQQLQWMAAATVGIQNLQLQQAINSAAAAQQQHDTMVMSQAVASAKGGISGYSSSSLPKQGGLGMDAEAADSALSPRSASASFGAAHLNRTASLPLPGHALSPHAIAAVLSGISPDNHAMLAEALGNMALVAQAQAHVSAQPPSSHSALLQQQAQMQARMMAPPSSLSNQGLNHASLTGTSPASISQLSSPNSSSLSRSGSFLPPRPPSKQQLAGLEDAVGAAQPPPSSAPKPIPGRSAYSTGSSHAVGVNSYSEGFGYYQHQHQGGSAVSPSSGGGIFGGEGLMSRTAPGPRPLSLTGGALSSDHLLPMIKEIWSKPGFGSQAGSQPGSLDVGRGYGSLMGGRGGGLGSGAELYGSFGSLA